MLLDRLDPTTREPAPVGDSVVKNILHRCLADDVLSAGRDRVSKRSYLYSSGQVDRRIYIVESGYIKTVTISYQGKECLVGLYGPGDVFGESAFVDDRRTESAVALTNCTVRPVSRLSKSPDTLPRDLMISLLELSLRRVAEQQAVITGLITMQSEHRLAATLLRLARRFGLREGHVLRLSTSLVTQQELSEMVGTTRSRVGYFLRCFNERGIVSRIQGFLLMDEIRVESFLMTES